MSKEKAERERVTVINDQVRRSALCTPSRSNTVKLLSLTTQRNTVTQKHGNTNITPPFFAYFWARCGTYVCQKEKIL